MSGGLRLVPLADRHLGAMDAVAHDPDVLRFTRVPDPVPQGFARDWLDRYLAGREDGSRIGFAVEDDAGTFLGLALAPSIDAEAAEVELGYIVAPDARERGVATALLRELTQWALDELHAQRIVLLIDAENAGSRRVAERCGYVREGVLRSAWVKQDRRADQEIWSRLPSDP